MNLESIQQEIEKIESADKSRQAEQEPPYNENPQTGRSFDIEKMIFELENIGNEYLAKTHADLKFDKQTIELHSEMLTFVIEKNFSIDSLKNSPEYLLAAQSIYMGISFYRTYNRLKDAGEI